MIGTVSNQEVSSSLETKFSRLWLAVAHLHLRLPSGCPTLILHLQLLDNVILSQSHEMSNVQDIP